MANKKPEGRDEDRRSQTELAPLVGGPEQLVVWFDLYFRAMVRSLGETKLMYGDAEDTHSRENLHRQLTMITQLAKDFKELSELFGALINTSKFQQQVAEIKSEKQKLSRRRTLPTERKHLLEKHSADSTKNSMAIDAELQKKQQHLEKIITENVTHASTLPKVLNELIAQKAIQHNLPKVAEVRSHSKDMLNTPEWQAYALLIERFLHDVGNSINIMNGYGAFVLEALNNSTFGETEKGFLSTINECLTESMHIANMFDLQDGKIILEPEPVERVMATVRKTRPGRSEVGTFTLSVVDHTTQNPPTGDYYMLLNSGSYYNILANVLQNTARQGISELSLSIRIITGDENRQYLCLTFDDNGKGFPVSTDAQERQSYSDGMTMRMYVPTLGLSAHGGKGLGLHELAKTIAKMGGEFLTGTRLNKGEVAGGRVEIVVPFATKQEMRDWQDKQEKKVDPKPIVDPRKSGRSRH